MSAYFIGIDVGTQGARAIVVDERGVNVASSSRQFVLDERFREEQSPDVWWRCCKDILGDIFANLPRDIHKKDLVAMSITSTSGTVIPLDRDNIPLHHAIMYSDGRSVVQGRRCKELAERRVQNGYTGFNASSGISKMLWYIETYPQKVHQIARWIHASDFIVGKLSGRYDVTDYTNVLKSGYDLQHMEWPSYIIDEIGLKRDWLQEVVPSGTVVGKLTEELASQWGVPCMEIVIGMTDGCASQMASGAVRPGDWNTTIGTTLVIKGVTRSEIIDPLGRLYSHRHPEGYWMPGGASNTGGDWISLDYDKENLDELNTRASGLIPTGQLAWPLRQEGERYPIMASQARGFAPKGLDRYTLYAANMEGVACIERLAYEIITELSGEEIHAVYTAGGGSKSDVWLRIRASLLNVPVYRCNEASGALGAAIMAASNTWYSSLTEAAQHMTSVEKMVVPEKDLVNKYEKQYSEFKDRLRELGYL